MLNTVPSVSDSFTKSLIILLHNKWDEWYRNNVSKILLFVEKLKGPFLITRNSFIWKELEQLIGSQKKYLRNFFYRNSLKISHLHHGFVANRNNDKTKALFPVKTFGLRLNRPFSRGVGISTKSETSATNLFAKLLT